jgi:hypothetical protein
MSLTPEETAPGGGFYQQCVQELQKPRPDCAKIQALATVSLVETLQEVARKWPRSAIRSSWRQDADQRTR